MTTASFAEWLRDNEWLVVSLWIAWLVILIYGEWKSRRPW